MYNSSEINWLYIASIREFRSCLDLNMSKEISMVSKSMREKLKPELFKNLELSFLFINFESRTISILYNNQFHSLNCEDKIFREGNSGCIEESSDDFIIALKNVKNFCKSFYLNNNRKALYYVYPMVKEFENLVELKIRKCEILFMIFVNIGKTLPSLKSLILDDLDLVKAGKDTVSESDIIFPHNLSYLKLFSIRVISKSSLPDPFEIWNYSERDYYSIRYFTLPKISIPSLKRIDYQPWGDESLEIEEFLEVNSNIESLLTRKCNLNISNSLNSLKCLDIDEYISLDNIDQASRLTFINSFTLSTNNFNYCENIRKICQLCPNAVNLIIRSSRTTSNFQSTIDSFLAPTLYNLHSLNSLNLSKTQNYSKDQILDFTNFSQIEKLIIELNWGLVSNIKFDNCKSLKQIKLINYENFNDKFKKKIARHNWKFKFSDNTIKGYKI